ncbi:hypothetical protein B5S32_g3239 [[Candida] boidinii]|nr:hypothetical protein B5S32_g3239 [[Candida] boidinii]
MTSATDNNLIQNVDNDPRIKPQKRLLTPLLLDKRIPPIPSEEERIYYPFRHTSFFNEMFFLWCFPVLKKGYLRTLEPEDLYKVGNELDIKFMTDRFYDILFDKIEKHEKKYITKTLKLEYNEENKRKLKDDPNFEYPKSLVLNSVYLTFRTEYLIAVGFKALADISTGLNPLLLRALIKFVSRHSTDDSLYIGNGIGYAIGVATLVFFSGINYAHFFHASALTGAKIKGVLTKVLLDKSLTLSTKSRHQFPPGSITSLLGSDLSRIELATNFFPVIPLLPVGLIITIVLLCVNLGGAALGGIAFFMFAITCIMICTKPLIKLRRNTNKYTDARVKFVKELLNNMKIIKYYSWEIPNFEIVKKLRLTEMGVMLHIQFLRNCITAVAVSLPSLSSMIGFLCVYGNSGLKSAADIFSSLSLFNILAGHVALFPLAMSSSTDAYIACRRVQEYILADDETPDLEYHKIPFDMDKNAIVVKEGCFEWEIYEDLDSEEKKSITTEESFDDEDEEDEDYEEKKLSVSSLRSDQFKGLVDINLTIKRNEFVVITGVIGSGKSSLLAALDGVMRRVKGSVEVSGSLLLCSIPWIQNATVKDNILFGKDFDQEKYRTVIKACALENDLDILPAGDRTEIGERGITLSGGQKARINLARAVYADTDILMMDDVLSAVDARVGKHIMQYCMMGLLKDKTRVLATHQLSLVGSADRIIFLNGDGTIDVGTQEELLQRNLMFANLMNFQQEGDDEEEQEDEEEEKAKLEKQLSKEEREYIAIEANRDERSDEIADEVLSLLVGEDNNIIDDEQLELDKKLIRKQTTQRDYEKATGDGTLIQKEHRAVNSVSGHVFKAYLRAGSGKLGPHALVLLMLLSVSLTTFSQLFANVWLSFWSYHKFEGYSNGFYIGIYVLLTLIFVVFVTFEFCLIVYVANNASQRLNIDALDKMLHVPMGFLDTTPLGRILNRFTKDTDVLDNEIAEQARMFLFGASNMVGIYIMCIIYLPYFAISLPFVVGYFICIFNFYQSSAIEIKRIEGVQRSLVYSNFNEILQGNETIKRYGNSEMFTEKSDKLINVMNESYFFTNSAQRWFALCLHGLSATINLVITLLCVCKVFKISAASSGLLVSYTIQISMQMISSSRAATQLENHLNSVERICEYAIDLVQEALYKGNTNYNEYHNNTHTESEIVKLSEPESDIKLVPGKEWPTAGSIQFNHVYLSYRPGLPYVLKDLDIFVKPSEKIGICGRTGAGKSTIMTALYRLSEISSGTVSIDGINISEIGLFELRSKLSIIPQDPVLFKGTIRTNLDPFNELSDDKLNDALRRSGLIENGNVEGGTEGSNGDEIEKGNTNKFNLDSLVEDEGDNFSLGERQLIALARALVRDSKILIMDEATSSVDYETDFKIQETIKNEFSHCTILCIAHRLKTILNYDRILVLDKGEVSEFDTPINLFNSENGIFKQMCEKSNIKLSDFSN